MKRLLSLITVALFVCTSCMIQGSWNSSDDYYYDGPVVTKSYNITDFNSIEISNAFDVELIQGDYSIEIHVPEELEERLYVHRIGFELKIGYKEFITGGKFYNKANGRGGVAIISLPDLKEIEISGATNLKAQDFNCSRLDIDCSGASKVLLSGTFDKLEIDCSGASYASIEGETRIFDAGLSGASKIDALGLECVNADLELSGASKTNVSVSRRLEAECSGASMVYYKALGRVSVRKNCSGASKVVKL